MAPAWAQPTDDGRLATAPAARNKQPILNVLQTVLPERGTVLEIASGTGQWMGRPHDFIGFDEGAQLTRRKCASSWAGCARPRRGSTAGSSSLPIP
jgi:Protein of unknown function (DUF938)